MTSINNYESVEQSEDILKKNRARELLEALKARKTEKFRFTFKKKYIAVASLVLMLGAAVYVNYLYTNGELEKLNPVGKNYGDSILVDGEAEGLADAASVFSEARVSRTQTREEAISTIQNLFDAEETDSEQVLSLSTKAETIAANMELETKIESMMKAKGFKDCVVYISEEHADVMVETEGLLETEAAIIKDAIIQETAVPVENIKIIEIS